MNLTEILKRAQNEKWSTGHFNFSESDQVRAVCEAAAELRSVAILGTSEGEAGHIGYLEAVALRDAFRKEFGIPIFLNSDHHKSVDSAKKAVDAGYDSIHIDLSAEPYDQNIAGTKAIVEYAHSKLSEVNVEGELGYLRGESKIQNEKIEVSEADYTDPNKAAEFIAATGINRLAIAVGNIHGISKDEPNLDIDRIIKIRAAVPTEVALVLHAGSGIPDMQIKAAITAGIANVHINTDIRVAYAKALRDELQKSDETTPYKFDSPAREALKEVIKQKLTLFGAVNLF
ncbi:class II fructose-bisphosphate aldolase [Candidatus Giovannonibacteria bacterium]|nr:class II fructose-bisphosphate aldolase [Candidatus Giovannonibacteria bacterium]